jgi:histidinol-phosphatase (PHP family)
MDFRQVPLYHRLINEVKTKYGHLISIKYALEADFIQGFEAKTKAIIDAYPYDYIIGSVHYVNGWAVDDPATIERWKSENVNAVWKEYLHLLRLSAQSGFFQIIGHCDLPKKYGFRATVDISADVKATAAVFKQCGVAVEINTAGLRKPIQEMYPSPEHLKIYCQAGVPLTFGSDAHSPEDVGRNFTEAVQLAKSAGYTDYLIFNKRQVERKEKLV